MIWNVILALAIIAAAVFTWRAFVDLRKRKANHEKHSGDRYTACRGVDYYHVQWHAVWACCITAALIIVSLICLGVNSTDVSTYKRSGELVTLKQQQRDALATIVKEELSTEQYAAIMAATPDTDVLIILGNNAANFLVEKTKLLVSLNYEVNSLVNSLAQDRISMCAYADNPISPRLFVSPECPAPITDTQP